MTPPAPLAPHTVVSVRPGTVYSLDVTEADVEQLAAGIVSETVAREAWEALGWRREAARVAARRGLTREQHQARDVGIALKRRPKK